MWICVFNETDTCFWLRQDTGTMNRSPTPGGMFRGCFRSIRHAFAIRSECIHGTFATCSFSVCYIFAVQKYGFCATKVWFLACKNPLFTLQKPPFWRARSGFLQSLN